jgi:hypothetical protein
MKHFSNSFCLIVALLLTLGAATPVSAQQGQYHLNSLPFPLATLDTPGALATYDPIREIDGDTISLRGEDDVTYIFMLTPDTIYCQGTLRVSSWTYLRSVRKKISITVLTKNDTDMKALVVWDQPPTIVTGKGPLVFTLPPICR